MLKTVHSKEPVEFVWYIVIFCTYLYIIVFFWLLVYFLSHRYEGRVRAKTGFIVHSAMENWQSLVV